MGYEKAKGRSRTPNFVMLRHDMMESPAWLSLSCNAKCVWLEIRHRFKGDNNGNIPLSCREAAQLNKISKVTAKRAFDELEEKGFIKVALYSTFTNKQKTSRRWIMTHEPFNERPPTNEWKRYLSILN